MTSQPIVPSETIRQSSSEATVATHKAKPTYSSLQKAAVAIALTCGILGSLLGFNVLNLAALLADWTVHNRGAVSIAIWLHDNVPRNFSKLYDILLNNLEFAPLFVVVGLLAGLLLPRKLSFSTIYFSLFFVICYDASMIDRALNGNGMSLSGLLPIPLFVACNIPIHIASVFLGYNLRNIRTEFPKPISLVLIIVGLLCIPLMAYVDILLKSVGTLCILSLIAWCLTPRTIVLSRLFSKTAATPVPVTE